MGVRASVLFALFALPLSAAKPGDVGLSSERLQRVHETVQRHIEAHDISGAVTVVARKGRLAHLEAHGLMDIDTKKAMSKDTLFWIASMTKPVTGVAVLMLVEEGTVRLSDPVSRSRRRVKSPFRICSRTFPVWSAAERPARLKRRNWSGSPV
jgi:CubicO group peptidase (beta-lactamase class C family)